MLPDTFGTTQFLRGARSGRPTGRDRESTAKIPYCRRRIYRMAESARPRPSRKTLIASDALDVDVILGLHAYFGGALARGVTPADFQSADDFENPRMWTPGPRIRFSAGWGTLLTNDFRDCDPIGDNGLTRSALSAKYLRLKAGLRLSSPTISRRRLAHRKKSSVIVAYSEQSASTTFP